MPQDPGVACPPSAPGVTHILEGYTNVKRHFP